MYLSKVETQLVEPVRFRESRKQNNEKIRTHATQWSHLETKFDMKKGTIQILRKQNSGWVRSNAYVCSHVGWVGLAKCLRNQKNC